MTRSDMLPRFELRQSGCCPRGRNFIDILGPYPAGWQAITYGPFWGFGPFTIGEYPALAISGKQGPCRHARDSS
jgi:hypothetical protein